MNGLLLIDKPAGISSFDVVRQVRRVGRTRKVGHTGTLDPLATGLLPIVVGSCTKLARFLTLDTKEYDFEMEFGRETTTGDAEGETSKESGWEHVTEDALAQVLGQFRGPIEQVPPIYSAIKINGERAYKLARDGQEVEMKARPVMIESLVLESCSLPRARLHTRCGSGTYVRSLARDIARALDSAAYTTLIRRTRVGDFDLSEATPLAEITPENFAGLLRSPMEMMRGMTTFVADEAQVRAIGYGQQIDAVGLAAEKDAFVAIADAADELVAMAQVKAISDDTGAPRLKPVRVLKPQ
ncbi:tRNA pseudouridine(55) synthase TruB [Bradymonas sediminis]|uniref:tRNA pseudouridine synthase B n=1 Tax=Bradymonas sediminis TaxID=1548548 RepID=A0A2Z4FKR4_9DELT|nr:tRNA pseudouridine(55) synthase TruB [Bradymonas sediminis]AWV89553.1 tRNA pseudouridine(55) synthase TruB [Bradymonas sediminis]TDP76713.1 tRNA pseudouridine synthase B [Bradymonas sediminis]